MERITYLFKDFYQIFTIRELINRLETRIFFFKYMIIDERIKNYD